MQKAALSHAQSPRSSLARLKRIGFRRRIKYVVAIRRETASMTRRDKPHSPLRRRTLRGLDEEKLLEVVQHPRLNGEKLGQNHLLLTVIRAEVPPCSAAALTGGTVEGGVVPRFYHLSSPRFVRFTTCHRPALFGDRADVPLLRQSGEMEGLCSWPGAVCLGTSASINSSGSRTRSPIARPGALFEQVERARSQAPLLSLSSMTVNSGALRGRSRLLSVGMRLR